MRTRPGLITAVVLSVLLIVGCGNDDPADPSARPTTSERSPEAPEETSSPTQEDQMTLQAWMVEGESLRPVLRVLPRTAGVARAAVEELLSGPTEREDALGIDTQVPEDVDLLDIAVDDGTAVVDLSRNFESGGGSATMRMRLAQLIYTVTQFDTVDALQLRLDGEEVETFSGEGLVISDPQRRKGYKDLLPPIVVLSPGIDASVSSPLKAAGTANVFEATVSLRLMADGEEIASGFTTATCGTGCRGTYSGVLEFDVSSTTEATLEVFESSAEDGSPLHLVEIPVLLSPE